LPALIVLAMLASVSGCMPYLTHDRSKVLLSGVDIDQTLKIASIEIDKGDLGMCSGNYGDTGPGRDPGAGRQHKRPVFLPCRHRSS